MRSNHKHRDRAAQIMAVALDLFSDKDYASVTVNQIADLVGVRHSLIYYYFENKEDLFHKTVENYVAETLQNFDASALQLEHPADLIEHWFDNNIERANSLRKLVKVMFTYSSARAHPQQLSDLIDKFYTAEKKIIAAGIDKGIATGVFRPVNADRTASFVSTHIDGIFFSSLMRDDVDLVSSMAELKQTLWLVLGYEEPPIW